MKNWTKKDKIACIIIFAMAILTTITFVSSITYSFLFDTHSVSDAITAGKVSLNLTGPIQFPTTITGNTVYSGANYTLNITNTSTSGAVYVYVCFEGNDFIRPIPKDTDWCGGDTDETKNYFFYKGKVTIGSTITFCEAFRTLDIGNSVENSAVNINFTVGAVQAQAGACEALIQGGVEGWANAPASFVSYLAELTE